MHAALAVLLGFNGLRVSGACGRNIDDLGFASFVLPMRGDTGGVDQSSAVNRVSPPT